MTSPVSVLNGTSTRENSPINSSTVIDVEKKTVKSFAQTMRESKLRIANNQDAILRKYEDIATTLLEVVNPYPLEEGQSKLEEGLVKTQVALIRTNELLTNCSDSDEDLLSATTEIDGNIQWLTEEREILHSTINKVLELRSAPNETSEEIFTQNIGLCRYAKVIKREIEDEMKIYGLTYSDRFFSLEKELRKNLSFIDTLESDIETNRALLIKNESDIMKIRSLGGNSGVSNLERGKEKFYCSNNLNGSVSVYDAFESNALCLQESISDVRKKLSHSD